MVTITSNGNVFNWNKSSWKSKQRCLGLSPALALLLLRSLRTVAIKFKFYDGNTLELVTQCFNKNGFNKTLSCQIKNSWIFVIFEPNVYRKSGALKRYKLTATYFNIVSYWGFKRVSYTQNHVRKPNQNSSPCSQECRLLAFKSSWWHIKGKLQVICSDRDGKAFW